jgi:putative membrane protein insertion efficiency factor
MPESSPSLPSRLAALPRETAVALVRLYQAAVSPTLHALGGPGCGCRFAPHCSHYAIEALRTRGVVVGLALSLWRFARCHPFSAGGFDPVPARRPSCVRVHA